jgi:hypothetical protein
VSERRRKKRRERRRAAAAAEYEDQTQQLRTTASLDVASHHYFVKAMLSLMERSPRAARIGVVFGGVVFVLGLLWLLSHF